MWFIRERTPSIHSIVTTPRELSYWLAIGLEITGCGLVTSVLLPAGNIAVV